MKPTIKYFVISTLITLLAICIGSYYHYFIPHSAHTPSDMHISKSDILHITYIGDSWAFMHRPYDEHATQLLSQVLQRPVVFRSYGICGLTSSEIYENLLCNDSLKTFLSAGCDICIVSAGINDSYKKMPYHYYTQSMCNIVELLLHNNIYPILQEIPDYDIEKCFRQQVVSRIILRHISMTLHDIPVDCKAEYRASLDAMLKEKGYDNKVSILRYTAWNKDFSYDQQHLYRADGLHLNDAGYAKLDTCISEHVLKITTSIGQ